MKKLTILSLSCALFISTIDVQFNASEVESTKVAETTEVVYAPTNPTAAQVEAAATTDLVVFEDSNLEAEVASELGVAVGAITVGDMESLTSFSSNYKHIADISGLEYATNLTDLNLNTNQISDISPLAGLTKLTDLDLDTNQISDISPVAGLTNLTKLNVSFNQVSDISAVAGLTNLTELRLGNNQISDISAVAELTSLTILHLYQNQVSDISALSGLTELTQLDLQINQISDISAVAGLTKLTDIELADNQISDISPLAELTNLVGINLHDNQISDISALSGLTNPGRIRLGNNQVSDLSPIAGYTSIDYLELDNNKISDLSPLAGYTNLMTLSVTYNQISDLSPLGGLPNLVEVYLEGQEVYADDLTVYNNNEIFFTVTDFDGTEYPISLGIPQKGTFEMEANWSLSTSTGSATNIPFTGSVFQTVSYVDRSTLTGNNNASVTEETTLTDEDLISLFKVVNSSNLDITVDSSAVDYSTPGSYDIVFTDTDDNELIGTLTVTDVLPTLTIDNNTLTLPIGSNLDDILNGLIYSATEITEGDLTSSIRIDDSAVDYSTPGNYEVIFTVADAEGNTVTKKVLVTILEDTIIDLDDSVDTNNSVDSADTVDSATDSETENSKSENVKSEQTETNEDNQLAMTGSESIVLFLISSLIIFIVLKFNLKKL